MKHPIGQSQVGLSTFTTTSMYRVVGNTGIEHVLMLKALAIIHLNLFQGN